jgi:hypothetical protein
MAGPTFQVPPWIFIGQELAIKDSASFTIGIGLDHFRKPHAVAVKKCRQFIPFSQGMLS